MIETKQQNGTETSSFGTNGRINHNSDKFYHSKLYSEIEKNEALSKIENPLPKEFENKFILHIFFISFNPSSSIHYF